MGAGEAEVIEEVFVAIEVMEVRTYISVEALFQEFLGDELGTGSIVATEGHQVELEVVAFIMEELIVGFVHVHISFGMGYEGLET